MSSVKLTAVLGALVLSGTLASVAHADPLITDPTKTALADRNQWGPQATHKSFEWDSAKSRWGLKLDLDQPGPREMDLNNVQAGAYYKLTPTLRVGGVVSLGDQVNLTTRPDGTPQAPAPRVRLETAFKF
jgi:hypothetical protein